MEIYFSIDIETDGPYPLDYSMLSFGAAAFTPDGEMIGTFSANLETLPGAKQHPGTMSWWKTQQEAWDTCRRNTRPAEIVIPEFVQWVKNIKVNDEKNCPVFVGYPVGFDFTFMYVYMMKFAGESPFSFSALDMKTMAMVLLKTEFRKTTKKNFPKRWFGKSNHDHIALHDAIEQGELFSNMLKEMK
jgi:DNA polymerase III alpha subunit (gram-positive type)